MAIQLTTEEVNKITNDFGLNGNKPNYAGMYQYIFDTYGSQMEQPVGWVEIAKLNKVKT